MAAHRSSLHIGNRWRLRAGALATQRRRTDQDRTISRDSSDADAGAVEGAVAITVQRNISHETHENTKGTKKKISFSCFS